MADDNTTSNDDECGGEGGMLSVPGQIISDCNLIARYPIHPRLRTRLVRMLAQIALDGSKPREKIAATKALIAMDKLNLDQEQSGRNSGVTVTIVNQAIANQPGELRELSDDDLARIASAGSGRVIEAKSSPPEST